MFPLNMKLVYVIILQLLFNFPRSCTIHMSLLLIQLVTHPFIMECALMPHVFLHDIMLFITIFPSHFCSMFKGSLNLNQAYAIFVELLCRCPCVSLLHDVIHSHHLSIYSMLIDGDTLRSPFYESSLIKFIPLSSNLI